MKLLFQKGQNGLELTVVECNTTDEADQFQMWFAGKMSAPANTNQAELPLETEEVKATPNVQDVPQTKVTRADLSKAAIALVQTKGRGAIEPILQKYSAKRISEIPENKLFDAYADVAEAM